ncbi:MAG TPA: hypothetical protein ENN99_14730 [Chloroflexi bacterium]|nr:hypothetical protein [Chloroflexota bacterium]
MNALLTPTGSHPSPVVSSPTLAPAPTPLPSPTATPIPPLEVRVRWPEQASALAPVVIEVDVILPPGVEEPPPVRAILSSPPDPERPFDLTPQEGHRFAGEEWFRFPPELEEGTWIFDLRPEDHGAGLGRVRYVSHESLQLGLEPPQGVWRLRVDVQSAWPVVGERELTFRLSPLPFHDLREVLPAGINLRLPLAFVEQEARGDLWAGARTWWYGDDHVSLWWAPGPAEPLLLNNAIVMLEATYESGDPPAADLEGVPETEWQGQTAFLFHEQWPGARGGPAEALVVQGPDRWLYVLRLRAMGGDAISPLLRLIGETFTVVE